MNWLSRQPLIAVKNVNPIPASTDAVMRMAKQTSAGQLLTIHVFNVTGNTGMERKGSWRATCIRLVLTYTCPEPKFTGSFGQLFRIQFTKALNHVSSHE